MPTASERVPNRPLGGEELKRIILADFTRLLDNEGALSAHLAYPRVGYDIRLRLHVANPLHPTSEIAMASRAVAGNLVAAQPELAAIESAPLVGEREGEVIAGVVSRVIDSPNGERLRLGMDIPVDIRQNDGTTVTRPVKYPADPTQGSEATMRDIESETRVDWGLLDESIVLGVDPASDDDHSVTVLGTRDEAGNVTITEVQHHEPDPPPGLPTLTDEQIAKQTERIAAIARDKVAQMTPEEQAIWDHQFKREADGA